MTWNIDEAQQHFPEILDAAKHSPQVIHQHNHPIAPTRLPKHCNDSALRYKFFEVPFGQNERGLNGTSKVRN